MQRKEIKVGDFIVIFDFENKCVEMKNINSKNKYELICSNIEYKKWENMINLYSQTELGSIDAMQKLKNEMINIIKEC